MPELPVKEVRLSELHLPEIDREEIVRSLSEIRLPAVDLPKIERPRIDLPESFRRFDWRSIDLTGALAGAAAIARLGRPVVRRRRWPFVAGAVIVVGAATAILLANPAVRERAGRAIRDLRARMPDRTAPDETLEIDDDTATTSDDVAASTPLLDAIAPEAAPEAGAATTVMDDMVIAGATGATSDDGVNGKA